MSLPKLSLQDIVDLVLRRNFENLDAFLKQNPQLDGFKFFEINPKGTILDGVITHNLGFKPQDVILTHFSGTGTVTFNYDKFTTTKAYYTTTGACRMRFFIGTYGLTTGINA